MIQAHPVGGLLARLFMPSDDLPKVFLDLLDRLEAAGARRVPALNSLSDADFRRHMEDVLPNLRAYARSLMRGRPGADDLVQDTLLKAWRARDRFQAGTNFRAWSFVILRNIFLSDCRRARFKGDWDDLTAARILAAPAAQEHAVHLSDLERAMSHLPASQREALMLVSVGGMSYDQAAEMMGVAVGTVKSRVARARLALEAMLDSTTLAITNFNLTPALSWQASS